MGSMSFFLCVSFFCCAVVPAMRPASSGAVTISWSEDQDRDMRAWNLSTKSCCVIHVPERTVCDIADYEREQGDTCTGTQ